MQIPVTRLMVELAVGKGLKECARGNLPRLLQLGGAAALIGVRSHSLKRQLTA